MVNKIIEFGNAFDCKAFKEILDKAMYTAVPVGVKSKWKDILSMMLMNKNPTLAVKIKLWDMLCQSGYMNATQEMTEFVNNVMMSADIDVIRNIIYIDAAYFQWNHHSLLLDEGIINKRESEGILNAMLGMIDDGSEKGKAIRNSINDNPQIDPQYKHFNASIEKVLYNNGQLVNSVYTIAPDGKNVSIGGRQVICGAGNAYYLDARGALRVSPKWRLIFLPGGKYAIEDSSHSIVMQGDLGEVSDYCGQKYGIDIVKVLRDNNIEANISNNTSAANKVQVTEKLQSLLDAREDARQLLESINDALASTHDRYMEELTVSKRMIERRMKALDSFISSYGGQHIYEAHTEDEKQVASDIPMFSMKNIKKDVNMKIYDFFMRAVCLELRYNDNKHGVFSRTFYYNKFNIINTLKSAKKGELFGFIQFDEIDDDVIYCRRYKIDLKNNNASDVYVPFEIRRSNLKGDGWWEVSVNPRDLSSIHETYDIDDDVVYLSKACYDDLCIDAIKHNDTELSLIYRDVLKEVYIFKTGAKTFSPIVSCEYTNVGQGLSKYYSIEVKDLVDWNKLYRIETNDTLNYKKYYYSGDARIKLLYSGNGKKFKVELAPMKNGNTMVWVFDDEERTIKTALRQSKQPITIGSLIE